MHVIDPSIQRYAWGGKSYIPELLCIEADGGPYAELWYGTHPSAPSRLASGEPLTILDSARGLPYLLKILSIAQPLSIQVHPSREQAIVGYALEEESGVPYDSLTRNFKDPNHKPETIVALAGGLEARAGLRTEEEIEKIICMLGSRALIELWSSEETRSTYSGMIELLHSIDKDTLAGKVTSVVNASESSAFKKAFPEDSHWIQRCFKLYGIDAGIIIQLMMNYVCLNEGEGLHMRAGELHAYLAGNGVEIMACSDNVVRAGLTPKHIDIPLLLDITSFEPTSAKTDGGTDGVFCQDGIADYMLRKISPKPRQHIEIPAGSIALCLSGGLLQNGSVVRVGQAGFFDSDQTVMSSGALYVASGSY